MWTQHQAEGAPTTAYFFHKPLAHVAQWQGVGCQSEVYQCKEGCSAAHDVVAQTHTWGSCPSFSRFTSRVISLNLYPVFSWHISPIARVMTERWGHGKEKSPSPSPQTLVEVSHQMRIKNPRTIKTFSGKVANIETMVLLYRDFT